MQIHDLTQQTPTTNSQLIFDTGSATYKALVSDIAKCIIEQYAGSTIGGTAQTLAAAIGPNITGRLGMLSNVNLDDLHTDDTCGVYWLNCGDTGITGTKPTESGQGLLLVKRQDSTYYRQVYISVTGTTETSAFRWYKANTAQWDTWQTASLQTSLDNKLDLYTGTKIESNADLNTFTTPGTYFCVNTATAATLVNSPLSTVGFRLEVSRNGYNTDNYLVQTIQAVSTSVVVIYKRGMSIRGTWGAWVKEATTTDSAQIISSEETSSATYASLDDIPLNTIGQARFAAAICPFGVETNLPYICMGTTARRMIIVGRISAAESVYINTGASSGWYGWKQIDNVPRQLSGITSLSDIPIGSNGYAQFDASVSPTGATAYFTYWCTGVNDRRSLIAVYTADSTAKAYVNVLHNSDGVTWKGWKSITLS